MMIGKYLLSFNAIILSACLCFATDADKFDLCPIKRFIDISSPTEFSQRFQGDSIFIIVPNADEAYFESFKLFTPDTLWLKKRPKNKLPQEHKHFRLINNFIPVSGVGVNTHRQYTSGRVLERHLFILRGSYSETVQYLGTFNYILLEDAYSGTMIKWDYTKNENKGLIILSPSILRHLSLMKGLDFLIEENDSTFIPAKCTEVNFSITVKPKVWEIIIDSDFKTNNGSRTSRNWNPKFFLKNKEE